MAGAKLCNNAPRCDRSTKRAPSLILTWIGVLVSMGTPVVVGEAKCSFTGLYLPSLPALELKCQCPINGADFPELIANVPITIQVSDAGAEPSDKGKELYDLDQRVTLVPNVQVVADERSQEDIDKGRAKLTLRRMNYTARAEDIIYTCLIQGRISGELRSKVLHLVMEKGFPTTTPTTTETPTTKSTTTWLPPLTLSTEVKTRIAATAGNTEGAFSGVGLYTVVGLSCVLLIVIVLAIICFVRVRARKRREQQAQEGDLDPEDSRPHTANYNLIYKPAGADRGHCQPSESPDTALCKINGDYFIGGSPARRAISQDHVCAVHTSCQPHCQLQIQADGYGQRRQGKRERGTSPADAVPLLHAHCRCYDQRQQRRRSVASEDEEGYSRRRQRLLKDTPRRSQPRDVVPSRSPAGLSRSSDYLDLEESPNWRCPRSHHFSFPGNVYGDTSDEELPSPGHHKRKHAAHCYPPRSWSQYSLHRHPRFRYASPGEGAHPENYFPVCSSTCPRHLPIVDSQRNYEESRFQDTPLALPAGHRYFYDSQTQRSPRLIRGYRRHGAEAPPLTVRVQEDDSVVYQDCYPSSVNSTDGRTSAMHQDQAGDLSGTTSGAAIIQHEQTQDLAGQDVQTDGEVTVAHGEPPVSKLIQQPRNCPDGRYISNTMPSSRRYRRSSSPHRSPHYNTTSMPRHRSAERAARSGRPVRHNLSHPHLCHLSDSGASPGPHPYSASENEDHLQPGRASAHRPHTRRDTGKDRRSPSVGNITAGAAGDSLHPSRTVSPEMVAPRGFHEVPQLPYPGESDPRQQMNLLSRESVLSSGGTPPPLNVPIRHEPHGQQHDNTHRKTPVTEFPAHTSRAETREGRSKPHRSRNRGYAKALDSSPNTTPPQDRRSSFSSSDNDNPRPSTSGRRRTGRTAEINLRDIKPDNETSRKRPVSFKAGNNAHPPVACVADVAESQEGGAHAPAKSDLQRKESVRSRGSCQASRNKRDCRQKGREEVRPGQEELRDLGVQMVSLEPSADSQYSHFTEHNHSTSEKTPHPRPE